MSLKSDIFSLTNTLSWLLSIYWGTSSVPRNNTSHTITPPQPLVKQHFPFSSHQPSSSSQPTLNWFLVLLSPICFKVGWVVHSEMLHCTPMLYSSIMCICIAHLEVWMNIVFLLSLSRLWWIFIVKLNCKKRPKCLILSEVNQNFNRIIVFYWCVNVWWWWTIFTVRNLGKIVTFLCLVFSSDELLRFRCTHGPQQSLCVIYCSHVKHGIF